jgi:hypothetical protein
MSEKTDQPTGNQPEEIDFLQAFFIDYDPIKNKLTTSFGQGDSTGKQFSGDLVLKAAAAKIRNLRPQIIENARGRILLIDGGASLAATQNIIATVFNVVSAVAIRDPKAYSPEGKAAYLVSVVVSTDKYSVGEYLYPNLHLEAPI